MTNNQGHLVLRFELYAASGWARQERRWEVEAGDFPKNQRCHEHQTQEMLRKAGAPRARNPTRLHRD